MLRGRWSKVLRFSTPFTDPPLFKINWPEQTFYFFLKIMPPVPEQPAQKVMPLFFHVFPLPSFLHRVRMNLIPLSSFGICLRIFFTLTFLSHHGQSIITGFFKGNLLDSRSISIPHHGQGSCQPKFQIILSPRFPAYAHTSCRGKPGPFLRSCTSPS